MKKLLVGFLVFSSLTALAQDITILGVSNIFMGNTYLTTTAGTRAYLSCGNNAINVNGGSARFPSNSNSDRFQATCYQVEDCARRVNGTLAEKIQVVVDTTSGLVLRAYLPNFCRW